jgi:hypothetical protein
LYMVGSVLYAKFMFRRCWSYFLTNNHVQDRKKLIKNKKVQ